MAFIFKQCCDGRDPIPDPGETGGGKMKKKKQDNKFDLMFKGGKMDKFFQVTARGSNATTEIRAGITTFLTAAYIMAVNPNILSVTGLNFDGLVFATAMSSFVATLIMSLWANLPFGLWPGMGMNAYFAYTVVAFKGTGHPVKRVMFAVFIEGIIFIVLSLLDLRRPIMKMIPRFMGKATMAGIGLFLAHIGLQAGNGIDILRDNAAVLVDVVVLEAAYSARTWIGIFFFCLMALMIMLRVKGAIIINILLSTFLCWILEAGGSPQFKYEPMCCLGTVTFPPTGTSFPQNNGWYPKPTGGWIPKPTCVNAETVTAGSSVSGVFGNWSISNSSGTFTSTAGSLMFKSGSTGRNADFKGGCDNSCHNMFGAGLATTFPAAGFNPVCFGSVQISTGCWSPLAPKFGGGDYEMTTLKAMGAIEQGSGSTAGKMAPYVLVDQFGDGCTGGAGQIPRTFSHPKGFAALPKAEAAGPIVAPWFGWFGCDAGTGPGMEGNCFAGNIAGGTIAAFDTSNLTWENFGIPLIVLLYIDFLGTMLFLYAAADLTGLVSDGNTENFPGCYAAFMADAVGTTLGGLLGTSSVTTYGESMAGVYEGGRTGMTALVIAFFNFLCIFLAPFISSIPTISTGPALMMVGVFMIEGVKDIDWTDYYEAIPSLFCIMLQPLTYKIEVGLFAGLFIYFFMFIFSLRFTIYVPALFKALPAPLKSFVANQRLNAEQKKKVIEAGFEYPPDEAPPPTETSTTDSTVKSVTSA